MAIESNVAASINKTCNFETNLVGSKVNKRGKKDWKRNVDLGII